MVLHDCVAELGDIQEEQFLQLEPPTQGQFNYCLSGDEGVSDLFSYQVTVYNIILAIICVITQAWDSTFKPSFQNQLF